MSREQSHIRHGFGSVRPYLYGHLGAEEWVQQTFGAVELEREGNRSKGFHVELRIGDSVVVLETGDPPKGAPAQIYVYVEDVDVAYRRALEAGATSIAEPADKPYQERSAGVKDSFGNTWWMSTYGA